MKARTSAVVGCSWWRPQSRRVLNAQAVDLRAVNPGAETVRLLEAVLSRGKMKKKTHIKIDKKETKDINMKFL